MFWKKKTCKFKGPIYSREEIQKCFWKNIGLHGKRKRCCNYIKKCVGKRISKNCTEKLNKKKILVFGLVLKLLEKEKENVNGKDMDFIVKEDIVVLG